MRFVRQRPPSSGPIRLGLVGLGAWGHQVALAAEQDPTVELAACYARSVEGRSSFAERYGCLACVSYEQLITDTTIDGIVVMTPNRTHRDLVVEAAGHGKHCLVTKPIATTVKDGMAMISACRNAGVLLAVGHQSRREPAIRCLKQKLEAGELGRPVLVECNISTGRGAEIRSNEWRWSREECPGGPLIQLGIHHVDTLQYLFGPLVRVLGRQGKFVALGEMDDATCTLIEFENGMIGYLGSSYSSSQACWIRVYASEFNACYDQHTGLVLCQDSWAQGAVRHSAAPGIDLTQTPIPTMREEVAEFVACVRTGRSPEIGGHAGLRNLAVVLAAVESNQTGHPVLVDDLLGAD